MQHAFIKSAKEPKVVLGAIIDEAMDALSRKDPNADEDDEVWCGLVLENHNTCLIPNGEVQESTLYIYKSCYFVGIK